MDQGTGLLLAHVRQGRAAGEIAAVQVDLDDGAPFGLRHLVHHGIAQDTGDVDDSVDAPEVSDGLGDHAFGARTLGNAVGVGAGLAAGGLDRAHDIDRWAVVLALAAETGAQVVDHDTSALGRQQTGDLTPDPPPGTRHQRHLAIHQTHDRLPRLRTQCRQATRFRRCATPGAVVVDLV